ncbi:tetratricopeptide repeat protein [Actinoallomurus sp. NPDC052308]|uniref:tetratricopeptide repeat protein n=1 Tax=Actinoallomurus sp. NPDC052308 TaxID=3155530 RepID=UPI00341C09C3
MTSSDFSLHGAIDLGARRAAAQRQQQRPASGASDDSSQHVIDVTDATFNTEVVERSRNVPVLVDFWADWCQPCKQLGPILEKLANEADGRWVLAKVDIDANPALGQQLARMGVQGIPFVAAVVAGQMLPVLNGAAPEPQVRQVLDQLFAALRQQGLLPEDDGADDAVQQPAADPLEIEAEAALQRGDLDGAATAFGRILETAPNDPVAKSGLALVDLQRRAQSYDPATVRKDAADRPDDAAVQVKAADLELVEGRIDDAFDRLIATVRRTAGDEREVARKHLLALFDVLPPDDPRVTRARRKLASALF